MRGWSRARRLGRLAALGLLAGLSACAHRPPAAQPPSARLFAEVRRILAVREPSAHFFRERARLEQMGPELDAVLVLLVRDPSARPIGRANALSLLADRNSPAALPVLRDVLLSEDSELLRAAAVLALQRLAPTSESAMNLIRSAVGDPARTVRLNALQALDIREVQTIRSVIGKESDPEVRQVAIQLVALAEARGAPLAPDRRGALRTAGAETDPQIVFRSVRADSVSGVAVGDLRVELPNAPDIPLSPQAEVVRGVVPAFFSPDRSRVVYEAEREIRVVDLRTRSTVSLGPGIAPRPVPFTQHIVFLTPVGAPSDIGGGETELRYEVYQAPFEGNGVERIGEIRAIARSDLHGNYSPARWMVVGETPEGFVLRVGGAPVLRLPVPGWGTNPSASVQHDQN